ncbi:sulfate transporter [Mycolicibacterium parafortuitum]|uniref:ATP-binding protein n=1 Tax=Mycolicibacterium parafortuitum TaxID=39692 RepID=UPI0032C3DA0F
MKRRGGVRVSAVPAPGRVSALQIAGTLDDSTYLDVRDGVVEAALDGSGAVVAAVDGLTVPADSAWTVFASARWHVRTWPGVPILLACADPARRAAIARSGITRHVPLLPAVESAARAAPAAPQVRRAAVPMDADSGLRAIRAPVTRCVSDWGFPALAVSVCTVATVLVENVLEHTTSRPTLILETRDGRVAVAVSDDDPATPTRREDPGAGTHTVSGLAIVTALSHAWGVIPTASGKTVWALLGPENRL